MRYVVVGMTDEPDRAGVPVVDWLDCADRREPEADLEALLRTLTFDKYAGKNYRIVLVFLWP